MAPHLEKSNTHLVMNENSAENKRKSFDKDVSGRL